MRRVARQAGLRDRGPLNHAEAHQDHDHCGIIFLIPVAILAAVIAQGLKIAGPVANPVAAVLPVNMVGGVAVAEVLAILFAAADLLHGRAARPTRART